MNDDTVWTMISFEPKPKPAVEQSAAGNLGNIPFAPFRPAMVGECPKCGKALKARGKHLHIRACKGAK